MHSLYFWGLYLGGDFYDVDGIIKLFGGAENKWRLINSIGGGDEMRNFYRL